MNNTRPLVLFHAFCSDGFCSAWGAHRHFGDVADYLPVQYGQDPPDVRDRDVYILDFSWKRPVMEQMAKAATRIVLLDHHRSAEADLAPVCRELADCRSVELSNGDSAFVDAEDLEAVSCYSWSKAKHGGAVAYTGGGRENAKMVYMHRLIMNAPDGTLVDHINRNPLDNRRLNLRFATRQQNAANMDRGSVFKGVTRRNDNWIAQIAVDGSNNYLGTFSRAEDAARAYDEAAKKAFGEFARCNFGERQELFPANCVIRFDMNKAGCRLTWEHFNHRDDPPPFLVELVEDRDLWRFNIPCSRELNAWLATMPRTFAEWDDIAQRLEAPEACDNGWPVCRNVVEHGGKKWAFLGLNGQALNEGQAVLRYQSQQVDAICSQAREITLAGYRVLAVNTSVLFSEVAGKLAEGRDFGCAYFRRADGLYQWSLRSRAGGVDVSEVAKLFGGGGHAASSGFQIRTEDFNERT